MLVAGTTSAATAAGLRALLAESRRDDAASMHAPVAVDGVDHAFEASGTVEGVETALAAVRPGGTVTLVGMPSQAARAPLDVYAFVESGARIVASNYGSAIPADVFPELARRAVDGSLPLERLIERRIGLDDVPAAFEALRRGDGARRVVIFPSRSPDAVAAPA